jgi:hypothetical protein
MNHDTNRPCWTVKQLKDAMTRDLEMCHTAHERIMCKAINGRHIRETAQQWAQIRKLTPAEVAIASEFGFTN